MNHNQNISFKNESTKEIIEISSDSENDLFNHNFSNDYFNRIIFPENTENEQLLSREENSSKIIKKQLIDENKNSVFLKEENFPNKKVFF